MLTYNYVATTCIVYGSAMTDFSAPLTRITPVHGRPHCTYRREGLKGHYHWSTLNCSRTICGKMLKHRLTYFQLCVPNAACLYLLFIYFFSQNMTARNLISTPQDRRGGQNESMNLAEWPEICTWSDKFLCGNAVTRWGDPRRSLRWALSLGRCIGYLDFGRYQFSSIISDGFRARILEKEKFD